MPYLGAPRNKGFSSLELMLAAVILSLLVAVALPAYDQFVDRAMNARAIGDIDAMSGEINRFRQMNNGRLPSSLSELPIKIPLDPWEAPYQYQNITATGSGHGAVRKDEKLNPLNSDYDLYSLGFDGASRTPLSSRSSRDDIVRANNGAFIGLAEDF